MSFLLPVIESFPHQEYLVTRVGGSYTAGVWTEKVSVLKVTGHIQPMGLGRVRELQPLPEGLHSEDVRLMFTDDAIQIRDRIDINGQEYECFKLGDWPHPDAGSHREAYFARRVRQEGGT